MNKDHAVAGGLGISGVALLEPALQYHFSLPPDAAAADAGLILFTLGILYHLGGVWLSRRLPGVTIPEPVTEYPTTEAHGKLDAEVPR